MSKLAFVFYYAGFLGLMSAYSVKEIWVDRISLILVFSGIWCFSIFWRNCIKDTSTSVDSMGDALDCLNYRRNQMHWTVRLMPNPFLAKNLAAKKEYIFQKVESKNTISAYKTLLRDGWEIVLVSLCFVVPVWVYGVGAWRYERFYRYSVFLHDLILHIGVFGFTFVFSSVAGFYFINVLLKEEK